MVITTFFPQSRTRLNNTKKQIDVKKTRASMDGDTGDFAHLSALGFCGLGKTTVAVLPVGLLFFFTGTARGESGWKDTSNTGRTSVVIMGDTTTTGTGTDITAVAGDGGTLTITLEPASSVGSTAGAVIVDGTGISNPGSGAADTTT